MTDYEVHPAAMAFPMIEAKEYSEFRESIRLNGLRNPIALWKDHDGKTWLIDGRNRDKACRELGIEPRYIFVSDNPFDYVLDENINLRHLTPSQLTACRIELERVRGEWSQRVAAKKDAGNKARAAATKEQPREDGGKFGSGSGATLPPTGEADRESKKLRAELAKEIGVSPRTVQKGITVSKKAPELAKAVREGKISLNKAYKKAVRTEEKPEEKKREGGGKREKQIPIRDSGKRPLKLSAQEIREHAARMWLEHEDQREEVLEVFDWIAERYRSLLESGK